MKNKIIATIILLIFVISIALGMNNVKAYTGEIDPKGYMTLPSIITIKNKTATGTIRLSSSATGYTISYQKIDITQSQLDNILTKYNALNDYIKTSNEEAEIKKQAVTNAQTTYQNLQQTQPENSEAIETARKAYQDVLKEFQSYCEEAETKIEQLRTEYYAAVPNYTNSWTTTTNSSNNVQLNFENYTGKVHFILWAKITNGTNTYYEFNAYSSEIKTTDTETGEETLNTVKFELKKEGQSSAIVEVSGIEPEEEASYYLIITNSSTKPNVENIKEEDKLSLTYDETSKTFKSHSDIAKYVELNQELYASILKQGEDGNTIIVSGKKLTRYAEPKYAEAISDTTHVTYTNAQIITNFTHSFANNRKMQIKIGKITDKSILRKIKNKDASAFSDLLKYAKSNSGIYNQNVEAEKSNSILSYKQKINLKNLEDGAYYYLYIKTDDENGKYISNETVTLAQASVYNLPDNPWYLFFYGNGDFKWTDLGEDTTNQPSNEKDDTQASGELPQTGISTYIVTFGAITLIVGGFIAYKKYKEYNF